MHDGGRIIWLLGLGTFIFSLFFAASLTLYLYLHPGQFMNFAQSKGGLFLITVPALMFFFGGVWGLRTGSRMIQRKSSKTGGGMLVVLGLTCFTLAAEVLATINGQERHGSFSNSIGGASAAITVGIGLLYTGIALMKGYEVELHDFLPYQTPSSAEAHRGELQFLKFAAILAFMVACVLTWQYVHYI